MTRTTSEQLPCFVPRDLERFRGNPGKSEDHRAEKLTPTVETSRNSWVRATPSSEPNSDRARLTSVAARQRKVGRAVVTSPREVGNQQGVSSWVRGHIQHASHFAEAAVAAKLLPTAARGGWFSRNDRPAGLMPATASRQKPARAAGDTSRGGGGARLRQPQHVRRPQTREISYCHPAIRAAAGVKRARLLHSQSAFRGCYFLRVNGTEKAGVFPHHFQRRTRGLSRSPW